MFERKFEFTVYHPLEVCEERVLDMGKSGCVPSFLYPVSSEVFSTKGHSEIYVRRYLTRHNIVQIEGIIEEVDSSTSKISGIATPKGFQENIVFLFGFAVFGMGFLSFLGHDWHMLLLGISIAIILSFVQSIQAVNSRNRHINKLETALTQPKKKNL